mmetsp:Transcript_21110/g.31578  ORF Transcript_21110/g.31578 Transcript_21110/m.31578 type:complete len:106 (+) Transcript_21110:160-477(+)
MHSRVNKKAEGPGARAGDLDWTFKVECDPKLPGQEHYTRSDLMPHQPTTISAVPSFRSRREREGRRLHGGEEQRVVWAKVTDKSSTTDKTSCLPVLHKKTSAKFA